MKLAQGLWNVIKREVGILTSKPIYMVGMILIPIAMIVFFVSLLEPGLPLRVPVAIVDLDHSPTSRQLTRSLDAMEQIDITERCLSFNEAMQRVQSGDVYGFFVIPEDFERDAIGSRGPTLSFYSNMTYYVPGTMVYKAFKTMSVTTSGRIVHTALTSKGASAQMANTILQPMVVECHPLNNPWLNYSYYLCTSFLPALLELMIFLVTCYSICHEVKTGCSIEWLRTAHNDLATALIGKLLPQTLVFFIIALGMNAYMFGWNHYPMNGSMSHLLLGSFLFVVACQSFAVVFSSITTNMRLAISSCSLMGILAFSVAAFSFPLEAMYGEIAIFAYILPVRWYFLIYIDQALNGIPLYFSRYYYVALLIFPIVATIVSPLMRRALQKPVYVP